MNIIRIIYFIILMVCPFKVVASDGVQQYKEPSWGLTVDVPAHWIVTETEDLLKQLENDPEVTAEILKAVKESGMLVTISEHSLGVEHKINPNVSIAAKRITTDAKPQEETEWAQFAGDVMVTIIPDPMSLSAPVKENINGLVGLSSNFVTDVPEKGRVRSVIYVLIDQQRWNYFIITATYGDNQVMEEQVKKIVSSVQVGERAQK